ncbi:ester cyclase [Pseudonocardia lutea]|jgi:predicted ester cyclase|uniref:Ester cyclase n=1 Tax=Pseudonocardia lutea TaxID=2172015 RepID=A0ABW1I8W8_9PSEU
MTTTTTESRNETALARAIERWNAGDLAGYLEVYDDRIRLHGMSPEPMDKPAVRAFYEKLWAAFPENHLELHETFGSGDRLVARFTLTGRHDGDFMGIPATGIRVTQPGITILHFAEARCVERWSCADTLGLLVQLGAVPPPP